MKALIHAPSTLKGSPQAPGGLDPRQPLIGCSRPADMWICLGALSSRPLLQRLYNVQENTGLLVLTQLIDPVNVFISIFDAPDWLNWVGDG